MDINTDTDQLNALLEPIITGMGFELIRISYGGADRPVLQIMAERPDGTMSIEDCTRLSREISTIMDVEDPIASNFSLEVSSPGIDRPLTRLKDFDNYSGFEAKVVLKIAVDDRRRFRGTILGTSGENILLRTTDTDEEFSFVLDDIQSAKLVITDELLKASQKQKQ
ncbi:MAG: ribosome maturation factor RimP [Sphingomonadales bacterium]|nr:ribosome maturation factor RimP [Sphingomonadales bacterium]